MTKAATLKVQRWGNSLAVRIPAAVARSARFVVGQPVELSVGEGGVLVKALACTMHEGTDFYDHARKFGDVGA